MEHRQTGATGKVSSGSWSRSHVLGAKIASSSFFHAFIITSYKKLGYLGSLEDKTCGSRCFRCGLSDLNNPRFKSTESIGEDVLDETREETRRDRAECEGETALTLNNRHPALHLFSHCPLCLPAGHSSLSSTCSSSSSSYLLHSDSFFA
jgi:hypothetical protein